MCKFLFDLKVTNAESDDCYHFFSKSWFTKEKNINKINLNKININKE